MAKNKLAVDFAIKGNESLLFCESCQAGKMRCISHKNKAENASTRCFERLSVDLCSPIRTPSFSGSQYCQVVVDNHSRFTFVQFLKRKSDAYTHFIQLYMKLFNRLNRHLTYFHSDNGTEYCNQDFRDFFIKNGITHELTVAGTPEQNGIVERKNQHLLFAASTSLIASHLPLQFWAEAMNYACFTINRTHTSATGTTPFERWYGVKPKLAFAHPFGVASLAHVPKADRGKFDPKSKPYIFVGYSDNKKAFKLYCPIQRKFFDLCDVTFQDDNYPAKTVYKNTPPLPAIERQHIYFLHRDEHYDAYEHAANQIENNPVQPLHGNTAPDGAPLALQNVTAAAPANE